MKNKKILATILLTVSALALTACGNTAPTVSAEETIKNQVVENTTTAESETAVQESMTQESAMIKDDSISVYSYKQGEITGYEVKDELEDDLANFEIIDPNFNGSGHEGTLEETVQSYITYEDIEPTTMYVINNTTGERYSTYHDPNVTEGELIVSGLVDANQELTIDAKATHNGIEYYRIEFQEAMMLNHQIIIPAEFVVAEKQETPAVEQQPEVQQPTEQQKPVEQQPQQQQPEVQQQQPTTSDLPTGNTEAPEWDASLGVSEEDWNEFFGGGNTTGQHTWTPDNGSEFQSSVNEKGGLDLSGGTLDPSEVGGLQFH